MDTEITRTEINLMRMSGLPPLKADYEAFHLAWGAFCDLVQEHYAEDMQKVHARLERYEKLLKLKYKDVVKVEMPSTTEEWRNFVVEHGPIMVAKERDSESLALVIADEVG